MDDTTDVAVATEPTSTEGQNILSFIGEDGSLKDGWRDFVPEEYRSDKVYDRAVSLEGIFKSLGSAERMVGKNKVGIPDKNSTDGDWNAFYKAVGMLDKPESYKFDKDPEIADEFWPEEITSVMQKASFEARVNEKQAAVYNKAFNEFIKQQIAKTKIEKDLEYSEELKGLKTEWSGSYDANIHLGNVALEKATSGQDELRARVKDKFGPDPDFARIMKNLGVNFSEGKVLDTDGTTPVTASDVDEQMEALRSTDAYKNKMNPGHKRAMDKMSRMYETKAKIR